MQLNDIDRTRAALAYIPPDLPRDDWVKVGMALHDAGLSEDDFIEWSRPAPSFDLQDCQTTYRSFKQGKGVGTGTLYHMAANYGWRAETLTLRHFAPNQPTKAPTPTTDPLPIWNRCEGAKPDHPYIKAKKAEAVPLDLLRVVPAGDPLRIMGESMAGALVVPCIQEGNIKTLQFITVGETAERLKAKGKPTKLNLPNASLAGWYTVGETVQGAPVYLCEGLGTAWTVWKATGCPAVVCFGWGRVRVVAETMRQKDSAARLVLCPDVGKEPEAQSIAAAVGAALAGLPDGWPVNTDWHDMAERDGIESVRALLDNAPTLEPVKLKPRFKLLTCAELHDLPPLKWRVRGVLPDRGLAVIAGPSASGKSFLAFDLAAAIACGWRWFGHRVEAAPVVYAALEGEAGYKLRADAWITNKGTKPPDTMRLMLAPFKLTEAQDVQDLAAVVPAGAVVIVDTLNRAAPTADENSSRDMGEILEGAKRLQSLTDGLVILVHHTGKDESRGLRGHSSLFAALDAVVTVKRDGDRREWSLTKSKDGTEGDAHPFKLLTETLGTDEHGDPLTSCVIVPSNEAPIGKKPKRMGKCQKAVLDLIASNLSGIESREVASQLKQYDNGNVYRAIRSLKANKAIQENAGILTAADAAR